MKPFFQNRFSTNLPQDVEILNVLYQEIKATQNFFPSERLKQKLERFAKIDRNFDFIQKSLLIAASLEMPDKI